ncbi:DUF4249 family protein [Jiulongibacter sediminis]|uniref:DUF4249 family protein n=1 Tax=Jiulongibacter sediminis TaxID=1605367 RepID=UPI0012FDA5EB|nr:DUF4249 family protein [Jiulongibacter sediminis]
MKFINYIAFTLLLTGCQSKYDFNVINMKRGLVIESFISNQSYNETLAIPSEGRYFTVKLGETSNVNNVADKKVTGASVYLKDETGQTFTYTENHEAPGQYQLLEPDFKAKPQMKYQLNVDLKEGQHFESSWESVPEAQNKLGDFSIKEVSPLQYVYESGDRVIKNVEGITLNLGVPEHAGQQPVYYKWNFEPLWIYRAELAETVRSTRVMCWVRSAFYQHHTVLRSDAGGGYDQELFFLQTQGNDRLYRYFSSIVNQDIISEGYYNFWKELKEQDERGGLFDQPPFGLNTNFTTTNSDWTVNGYFAVVSRKSTRWTFDPDVLSYAIKNNLKELCLLLDNEPGGKSGQCYYCDMYNMGEATTQSPLWWP